MERVVEVDIVSNSIPRGHHFSFGGKIRRGKHLLQTKFWSDSSGAALVCNYVCDVMTRMAAGRVPLGLCACVYVTDVCFCVCVCV